MVASGSAAGGQPAGAGSEGASPLLTPQASAGQTYTLSMTAPLPAKGKAETQGLVPLPPRIHSVVMRGVFCRNKNNLASH